MIKFTIKVLCDRCKREFDCDEDLAETEWDRLCPDCKLDSGDLI